MEERPAAELGHRVDHAAAGAKKLGAFVGEDDLRTLARRQVLLDLVRQVMHVHDRALDSGVGQPVQHVVDQRLAGDRHQRLGNLAIVRAHPGAEPGGQNHGEARRGAARRVAMRRFVVRRLVVRRFSA